VSAFTSGDSRSRNKSILEEWFLPTDVEQICKIPLSTRRHEDDWAWHYDRSGALSVRSVYRLWFIRRELGKIGSSSVRGFESGRTRKGMEKMWSVQIPSKLRVFLWRVAHEPLPTGDVHHRWHMADSNKCSICGEDDSWRHSLIDCTPCRCVWALVSEEVTEHRSLTLEPSAKQWIFSTISLLEHATFVELVVTLWDIWYARRRWIHEGEQQSPLSTFLFVRNFLDDLAIAAPLLIRGGVGLLFTLMPLQARLPHAKKNGPS
jgi:hypothetical protein